MPTVVTRGGDNKTHSTNEAFTKRTIFSGWDVFRSQFPLQTIINPSLVSDQINSLVTLAEQSGKEYYERWEIMNAYSGCMLGNPALSVLADAYVKGIRTFDIEKAYEYAKNTSRVFGNDELGYTPSNLSISHTLEYAYTDWCISQLATAMGKDEEAKEYARKSQAYRNIFDKEKGWFRPREADGSWQAWPENARITEWYGCVESNPYQQGWFVPHDVEGMVELMGGREAVLVDLNNFFEKTPDDLLWNDYYNHANEPVHFVPFLTAYRAIENCNSIIEGIEGMEEGTISEAQKAQYLGETYFFRGYFYFNLVRLYGSVPLKLTSTKDISNTAIELSSVDAVYAQIDADMAKAGELMENTDWTNTSGRVSKGTVKSMHAKVLLTMAGYPLQKGTEYYTRAYNMAKEVYSSGRFSLFGSYEELRTVENAGEIIWSVQREADNAGNPLHSALLAYPAPAKAVSASAAYGGAITVTQLFYDTYPEGDSRKEERTFYYTGQEALDGSGMVDLGGRYIYKYWDQDAAETGKSGANFTLLRYADVLLMMAEAKAQADGGTTTDADAIEAYYAVRKRALPQEVRPTSITVDKVLQERFWELAFENQTWYDMVRTRRALHAVTGQMVNMIGYQTPSHIAPFTEESLLLPYPIREKRLNPNLVRN